MTQAPTRGLGRGLAALLDDAAVASIQDTPKTQQSATAAIPQASQNAENTPKANVTAPDRTLPISELMPSSVQPRRIFNEEAIAALSASIKEQGVLQPLLVRPFGNKYEIIGGERRWRASQAAGLTQVPVIIRDLDDGKALEVALVENIQRADLNPLEESEGYQRLKQEFAYTHEDMARVTGKSRSHITNLLRLLTLPVTLKNCVSKGSLTMGHARALLGLSSSSELQIRAANKVIKHGLSVRETEDLVRNLANPDGAVRTRRTKDSEVTEIEKQLQKSLGMKVAIRRQAESGAGSMRIFFDNPNQMQALLSSIQAPEQNS